MSEEGVSAEKKTRKKILKIPTCCAKNTPLGLRSAVINTTAFLSLFFNFNFERGQSLSFLLFKKKKNKKKTKQIFF